VKHTFGSKPVLPIAGHCVSNRILHGRSALATREGANVHENLWSARGGGNEAKPLFIVPTGEFALLFHSVLLWWRFMGGILAVGVIVAPIVFVVSTVGIQAGRIIATINVGNGILRVRLTTILDENLVAWCIERPEESGLMSTARAR